MLFGAESLGEIVRIFDTELRHHLLLLCRARLTSRKGSFKDWRRFARHRSPSVKFLAEEICFVR